MNGEGRFMNKTSGSSLGGLALCSQHATIVQIAQDKLCFAISYFLLNVYSAKIESFIKLYVFNMPHIRKDP